jgi:CHAD domain-containing protein
MTLAAQPKVNTFGEYAYEGIQRHFKKVVKWESSVKKDEDPEALHQMRIGMRRLRTAVSRFAIALNLPKPATDRNIGRIARRLGSLRDLDVLKETLDNYQSKLPGKEQEALQTVFHALDKQRESALSDVRSTLKDERYKSLKVTLNHWLEEPNYRAIASLPIQEVLPDLLLPEVSKLLLHPAWLLGTENTGSELIIPRDLSAQSVEEKLVADGDILHDLRKQAKRIRYQMELFSEFYGESYAAYLGEIRSIQEILGFMQDDSVLNHWLEESFKSEVNKKLPTFANLLVENRRKLWQQWQPLQERYLKAETRHGIHLAILHPV